MQSISKNTYIWKGNKSLSEFPTTLKMLWNPEDEPNNIYYYDSIDTYSWVLYGSSGGGHIIADSDETFIQRTGLQFTGNVSVTDDSLNGNTVVEILGDTITVDAVPIDGSPNPVSSGGTSDALANKVDKNTAITGATKTKVTYDAKGLVTSGTDATTADIADSLDKRYVTEAEKVDIAKIDGIEAQISANQLTFASIYGYYNFI